jgi:phage-related protein
MNRKVGFYKTENGKIPIQEYLDSLPGKIVQKITWVLSIIEELKQIPLTYFRKITSSNGIYEIRIKLGSNIFRLLGFFYKDSVIILTNGFTKKTEKTPMNEIELAEKYKEDHIRRFP